MGRPLNSKYFGANQLPNLRCKFNNGSGVVQGYILKQTGSNQWLVTDTDGNKVICRLVPKAQADLLPREMSLTVKLNDNSIKHVVKITDRLVYVDNYNAMPWNFVTPSAQGDVIIEEAGYNSNMDGSTSYETGAGPFFLNLFGNIALGPQQDSIVVGSVAHDSLGDIYMIGNHSNSDVIENLYLKYDQNGNLLWRKTWTDDLGMSCGSYNQSLRIDHANSDMMYWCSVDSGWGVSYVGHMDTDGNLIRHPVQIEDFFASDLELAGGNNVYVAGSQYTGVGAIPTIAKLDVTTGSVAWTANVVIDGSDINSGLNVFHTLTHDPVFELAALGVYSTTNGNLHTMFSHFGSGGDHYKVFDLGSNTAVEASTFPAAVVSHAGNAYVMVNEAYYNPQHYKTVITKLEYVPHSNQSEGTWHTAWQKRLGGGCVEIIGTSLSISGDNLYASGTLLNQAYPPLSMVMQLSEADGSVNWARVLATADSAGATFPVTYGLGPLLSGTGDISIKGDRIAFGSYQLYQDDPNVTQALMAQLPTDGRYEGIFGPFAIYPLSIPSEDSDIGIVELSYGSDSPTIVTNIANLLATTSTQTSGFEEFHWDLATDNWIH